MPEPHLTLVTPALTEDEQQHRLRQIVNGLRHVEAILPSLITEAEALLVRRATQLDDDED